MSLCNNTTNKYYQIVCILKFVLIVTPYIVLDNKSSYTRECNLQSVKFFVFYVTYNKIDVNLIRNVIMAMVSLLQGNSIKQQKY